VDDSLRALTRRADAGDEAAAGELERHLVRSGRPAEAAARRFTRLLTTEGALWIAGAGWFVTSGSELLGEILRGFAPRLGVEHETGPYREASERVVQLCRERARREWSPIPAVALLGSRDRIRRALGIERMPAGIGAEERRLRQAWADELAKDPYYADTDVLLSSWRPPKRQPAVMGWERFVDGCRVRRRALRAAFPER
jgi:hypothetical protein